MLRYRLLILFAALLWSTGGAAIKVTGLTGAQVSSGRALVAALLFFLVVPASRRLPSWKTFWVPVAYAATVSLFVLANKLTTSANAIFLQDMAPVYVLALSPWILKEAPSRRELYALPLFLIGLSLFFVEQLGPGQLGGNVLAVLAGIAFAFTIVGLRWLKDEATAALAWGNVLAAGVGVPFALSGPAPSMTDTVLILYLGLFQVGLAYISFQRGLRHVRAVEASLLILLEPVLNPLWAYVFVGERPGAWAITGGAVILGATVWQTLAARSSGGHARTTMG